MRKQVLLISVLFFSHCCALAFADTDNSSDKLIEQEGPVNILEKDMKVPIEKENLYKLLYDNSSASNDRIITTIQWSLGIISSFILLFLGGQVFFNNRVNKEEVGAIRSDSEERFTSFKSELLETIGADITSKNKEISSSMEKITEELKNEIARRVDEKEKYLDAKIGSLQKDYSSLENKMNSMLNDIKIQNHNMKAEIWRLRGIEANALSGFVEQATMEIGEGKNPRHTLKEIMRSLSAMEKVRTDTCDEIIELSEMLPDSCNELMAEIKGIISTLPKYMFIEDPGNPGELKTVHLD
ncbi:MAG: hypothetical protein KUG81_08140 [Gammaproteobacteria bacterium]|nr:hypothetical protein [Gammaproteobacteria bacterium]